MTSSAAITTRMVRSRAIARDLAAGVITDYGRKYDSAACEMVFARPNQPGSQRHGV